MEEIDEKQRKTYALRKKLYNAARMTIAPSLQGDSELIKIRRDSVTIEMFNKTYDAMTDSELIRAINHFGKLYQSEFPELAKQTKPITPRQLRMLRYFALSVAIEYADFGELAKKESTPRGVGVNAEHFRNNVRFDYTHKRNLPDYLIRFMFEYWINPKCHQFLIEGGFKKETKNPAAFDMTRLTVEQAQALITRFQKINESLNKVNDLVVELN